MKKIYAVLLLLGTLFFYPLTTHAGTPCDDPPSPLSLIAEIDPLGDAVSILSQEQVFQQYLDEYTSRTTPIMVDGMPAYYILNFGMTATTSPLTVYENHSITLNKDQSSLDVYICNLKLTRATTYSSEKALLTITNNSSRTIYIYNSTLSSISASGGLRLTGPGQIVVSGVTVNGDTAKSGSCLDVYSPGAQLENVTAHSCNEGASVHAKNVQFTGGQIYGNHIGIHVYDGATGMTTSGTLIYDNMDDRIERLTNIRRLMGIYMDFDPLGENNVQFNAVETGMLVTREADEYGVHRYAEDETVYIKLPDENPRTAQLAFYYTAEEDCGVLRSYNQICRSVGEPVSIDTDTMLRDGNISLTSTAVPSDKNIVLLYTSSETHVISEPFNFSRGEIFATVPTFTMLPSTPSGMTGERVAVLEGAAVVETPTVETPVESGTATETTTDAASVIAVLAGATEVTDTGAPIEVSNDQRLTTNDQGEVAQLQSTEDNTNDQRPTTNDQVGEVQTTAIAGDGEVTVTQGSGAKSGCSLVITNNPLSQSAMGINFILILLSLTTLGAMRLCWVRKRK